MPDGRFNALIDHIKELHDKKQKDYGTGDDPFANIRASVDFGVAPWVGALIRLNDKIHRLTQFVKKGTLANESAEDSMMDIAVYALIALILYREESGPDGWRGDTVHQGDGGFGDSRILPRNPAEQY